MQARTKDAHAHATGVSISCLGTVRKGRDGQILEFFPHRRKS
ncbi:hypothetical protein HMPREF9163_02245 [Selenomonas sp. oral taxon 138 str. F0429]|nr:hypothetical protein HMPREF9163_02245 [Selenomonas sp. oral taxon 138 str. F0429]